MATGAGTMGQSVLLLRNFHHGDTWESEREREREENRDEGQIPLTHLPACCSPEAIVNIAVRGGSNYMYSTNPLKTQCWSLNSYCKKRQKHLTLRAWLRYLKNSDQCIKWTSLIHSMLDLDLKTGVNPLKTWRWTSSQSIVILPWKA